MSTSDAPPPRELLIDAKAAPGDSSGGSGTAMAPIAIPVLAAGFLAKFVSPVAGLIALGGAVIVLVAIRKPSQGRFILRVEGDVLEVTREKPKDPPVKLPLADVLNVTLDRKPLPAGAPGGSADRARLLLQPRAPHAPIHAPEDYVTSLEAQEWAGKVRVFLRKHGWLPKDERTARDEG